MEKKLEALAVIKQRIETVRETLGLITYKETPTTPVAAHQLPAIFVLSGSDIIVRRNSSGALYDVSRTAEVAIELIIQKDKSQNSTLVYDMYVQLRDAVLIDQHPYEDVTIRENRVEGPQGYGLPDVVSMRLILDMDYTDYGK